MFLTNEINHLIEKTNTNINVRNFYSKFIEDTLSRTDIHDFDFSSIPNNTVNIDVLYTCCNLLVLSFILNSEIISGKYTDVNERGMQIIGSLTFFCMINPLLSVFIKDETKRIKIFEILNDANIDFSTNQFDVAGVVEYMHTKVVEEIVTACI